MPRSQADVIRSLTVAAEAMAKVKAEAAKARQAINQQEPEPAQRQLTTVAPPASPLTERQR